MSHSLMPAPPRRATIAATILLAFLTACGGDDGGAASAATTATSATTPSGAPIPPAPGGAPGGGPGRTGGSVVLSRADVHTVARGEIEAGIAISGNLRPIETVSVRARIEGDLVEMNAREGDIVRSGAVLARFESSEQEAALRSAQADELAARAESQTAQWNLEQTRDLFKAGAVPEREMRNAEQAALTAAARLAAAESRVRAARSLERDTRVTAPVDGVVERRSIENGERVSRGAELFTVVRSDVLELTAAVPARRASALARGLEVRFTADGRMIEGRVARVSPTIDLQSQSVTVYVQVPNARGELKGNTFATGQIIERSLPDQLLLPQAAIRQTSAATGAQTFVWKVAGGTLARADVQLGIVDEARGLVQVLAGIAAGDEIVVGNVGLLGAGMQVQVIGTETTRARP
jgi:membrane fusion protein (multidrug efflux system)